MLAYGLKFNVFNAIGDMEKIRKGNDIEVQWAIYAGVGINEAPYDLTGKNLSLFLKNQFGRTEVYEYTIERHVVRFMFWGKDQKQTGTYSIELVENEGRRGMHTVDECDAFTLVNHSCQTGGDSEGRVECIHLQFRANMGITVPTIGTGGDVTIDDKLSLVSENPVQNKVITLALSEETERAKLAESRLERQLNLNETKLSLIEESISALQAVDEELVVATQSLDVRITKIEEMLDSEDLDVVTSVLTKVGELEEGFSTLSSSVAGIGNEMDALETDVNALEKDVDMIEDNIISIQTDIKDVNSDIDTLNADDQTEGSVLNKIAQVLHWDEIE